MLDDDDEVDDIEIIMYEIDAVDDEIDENVQTDVMLQLIEVDDDEVE